VILLLMLLLLLLLLLLKLWGDVTGCDLLRWFDRRQDNVKTARC
jgi:hypothetical protein